ncbi:MAG TPA: sialate O-acetylesterase [Chitinophagaceae bacterium]|nr:sialate O-acetylesterase [Chitinophagaceae bacterium]
MKPAFILSLLFIVSFSASAKVRLPALVGDHMVLQRDVKLNIWGWADKNEVVQVLFLNQKLTAKADIKGRWKIELKPIAAGGPFTLTVKGKNTIVLEDVMVGDVWLCGGQSNMGWKLSWGVDNHQQEIAAANYPNIRLYKVKEILSYSLKDDVETNQGWQHCSPATVADFSAVAYFFGRELYRQYNVPIGLLSSNWGGTPAEAWMSPEALKKLPAYKNALQELQSLSRSGLQERFDRRLKEWSQKNIAKDKGFGEQKWHEVDLNDNNWKKISLPGLWEYSVLPDYDGSVWFRKEVVVDQQHAGKPASLMLGRPDDMDSTWFNGVLIGGKQGRSLREYTIPSTLLRAGKNIIATRIVDFGGDGGIEGKHDEMHLKVGDTVIPLQGDWMYRSGDDGDYTAGWPPNAPDENASELTVLYNSMIAPLTNFGLKGVIFYQGEANVNRAEDYLPLFTGLIEDWRAQWQQKIPFIFAQLSTVLSPPVKPEESKWALLREAQLKTLSAVDNAAMAVTIDIGSKDVHPRNKQDVGKRLAIAARKVAYGEDIVHSGPVYQSMKIEGDKIRLSFNHTGSGLMVKDKYGYLKGFAIAGEDKKFVWAKAALDGNTVVVWSDDVKEPIAVRYGWAANPDDVNLYNKEGLPASPFRTDVHSK